MYGINGSSDQQSDLIFVSFQGPDAVGGVVFVEYRMVLLGIFRSINWYLGLDFLFAILHHLLLTLQDAVEQIGSLVGPGSFRFGLLFGNLFGFFRISNFANGFRLGVGDFLFFRQFRLSFFFGRTSHDPSPRGRCGFRLFLRW